MPKISFEYSSIYDQCIHNWQKLEFRDAGKEAKRFIEKISPGWKKIEQKVFKTMSEVTGLPWKKDLIEVYLVQKSRPFSRPLTMPMDREGDVFYETLIHELAHNIIVQNLEKMQKVNYTKYGTIMKSPLFISEYTPY